MICPTALHDDLNIWVYLNFQYIIEYSVFIYSVIFFSVQVTFPVLLLLFGLLVFVELL